MYLCMGVYTLMTLFTLSMPFLSNIYAFAVCIWLLTFCLSFMEPILTGIMLHFACQQARATAISLAVFV